MITPSPVQVVEIFRSYWRSACEERRFVLHAVGMPFTVGKGESVTQRVGVLVHKGDAVSGRVRQRYEKYVRGDF